MLSLMGFDQLSQTESEQVLLCTSEKADISQPAPKATCTTADQIALDMAQAKHQEELRKAAIKKGSVEPWRTNHPTRYWIDVPADAQVWVSRAEAVVVGNKQRLGGSNIRRIVLLPNFCPKKDYLILNYSDGTKNIGDANNKQFRLLAGTLPEWSFSSFNKSSQTESTGAGVSYEMSRLLNNSILLRKNVAKSRGMTRNFH